MCLLHYSFCFLLLYLVHLVAQHFTATVYGEQRFAHADYQLIVIKSIRPNYRIKFSRQATLVIFTFHLI